VHAYPRLALSDVHGGTIVLIIDTRGCHLCLGYSRCDVDERLVDRYSLQIIGIRHEDGVELHFYSRHRRRLLGDRNPCILAIRLSLFPCLCLVQLSSPSPSSLCHCCLPCGSHHHCVVALPSRHCFQVITIPLVLCHALPFCCLRDRSPCEPRNHPLSTAAPYPSCQNQGVHCTKITKTYYIYIWAKMV
jgi:hypothetical protein